MVIPLKIKQEIKKYIKDYKFNSLFFKNLVLLFLLIIVPVSGTVIITYYSYNNMQQNEIKAYNQSIISDIMLNLDSVIRAGKTQLIYIGFNSNVELYMYDTEEITQLNYKIKNISELIRLPVVSKDFVDSIYIKSDKSNKVITGEGLSDYSTFSEREVFEHYKKKKEDSAEICLTTNTRTGYPKNQISLFQDIRYGTASTGTIVMNLKINELTQALNIDKASKVFVTDDEYILLSNEVDYIGKRVEEIEFYKDIKAEDTVINKDCCITSKKSSEYGFNIISSFDLYKYQSRLSAIRNFMSTFVLIMIVITIGIGIFISVRLFAPIGRILSSLDEYSTVLIGNDNVLKEKDELMYILNSIKKTADTKKDIEYELSERVRLLKKAQSVALQSQINPHFMNNTLETINWMAIGLLGGKNEISEMTNALSKMLRMALENSDTIIPLKTEIEHCESYIEIQKKRYEDKFQVVWKIPEELYQCKIIRIALQPIVENAIYHGIKHLTNKGIITIDGRCIDDAVEIRVCDNGLGLSHDEVSELNNNMKCEMIKESSHIGITNVNQRFRLYFGEEYGIHIESTEGIGTNVIIKFPYII